MTNKKYLLYRGGVSGQEEEISEHLYNCMIGIIVACQVVMLATLNKFNISVEMQECNRNWLKSGQEPSVLCGQEMSGRSEAN